ncbi:MAG: hypothetical protein EAZ07_02245 [Cytophagales bacterium]|nr:MAG: hypothetical protein EAZ07_02245 [Cytophagales bacterium]
MKFRTEIQVNRSSTPINFNSHIVSLGSCFADVIGKSLHDNKLKVSSNPMGIIYNPICLFQNIFWNKQVDLSFIARENRWYNYQFHSSIFADEQNELKKNIINQQQNLQDAIKKSSHLIITLGTAWIYELKSTNTIVANCHKSAASLFEKKLLSVTSIIESYSEFHQYLLENNPDINILFTISPVRHLKDTLELNAVSKSILRIACFEICKSFKNTFYFPAYELLLDDLRDYRFYKEDLLHPTIFAEQYILNKFYEAYFSSEDLKNIEIIQQIRQGLQHKPFEEKSQAHQTFLNKLLDKAENLNKKINMNSEIAQIKTLITPIL